jgi:hypothetical protein
MTGLCQQALKNLKTTQNLLHRNSRKCRSAKQCGFSNRQWCNLHNTQQLATWHSQPGKWSPCNAVCFLRPFPVNVRTVPICHLIKCIGTQGKGKALPLQALTGPEGSRRLRLPDFKTIGNEGDKVVSPTNWPPLPPGNIPGTHFC